MWFFAKMPRSPDPPRQRKRQEGRISQEGKDQETATGEGKTSKGARVDGKGGIHGNRKEPQNEARNSTNPKVGSGVQ
jgi:hypothetical protein